MNKRVLRILLLVITIASAIYFFVYYNRERSLSSLALNQSDFNAIKAGRTETDDLSDTISFNSYPLFYDETGRRFYYSLIEGNGSAYDPGIRWNNKTINVCFDHSEITEEMIHRNETMRMLIYDDQQYSEYEIACTTLPLLNIDVSEISIDDNDMKLTLFDNRKGASRRNIESKGKIRIKGQSTTKYPKKAFRFSLLLDSVGGNTRQNDLSLLGLRYDDDYILYAGYNDQEKIRNVFNCRLWHDSCAGDNLAGIEDGTYYRYVELFIDHEYWGLYALAYPIDAKQMQISDDDLNSELEENFFQKDGWSNVLEMDYDSKEPLETYDLKKHENSEWAWFNLRNYYRILQTSDDPKDIYQICDISNAIDIYLFCSLIMADDTIREYDLKNMYLTQKRYDDRLIMIYTPWDMDISWGNDWSKKAKNYTIGYCYSYDHQQNLMKLNPVNYLLERNDPQIRQLIRERYDHHRSNGWSFESISAILDEYEKEIYGSGAYLRDQERWPDGTYSDKGDELDTFREFVRNRLAYFDGFVDELTR